MRPRRLKEVVSTEAPGLFRKRSPMKTVLEDLRHRQCGLCEQSFELWLSSKYLFNFPDVNCNKICGSWHCNDAIEHAQGGDGRKNAHWRPEIAVSESMSRKQLPDQARPPDASAAALQPRCATPTCFYRFLAWKGRWKASILKRNKGSKKHAPRFSRLFGECLP